MYSRRALGPYCYIMIDNPILSRTERGREEERRRKGGKQGEEQRQGPLGREGRTEGQKEQCSNTNSKSLFTKKDGGAFNDFSTAIMISHLFEATRTPKVGGSFNVFSQQQ